MTIDADGVTSGEAWRTFCARIAAAGDRIIGDEFPAAARDRAEGVRHVANQVACWLTFAVGFTDTEHPAFFRSADPVYRWGGPNVDQVARRAAIAGDGVYRVSGRMGSCEDFVLQVKVGATQSGGADIATEVFASQLGLGPGDDFQLVFGGDPAAVTPSTAAAHWFPLDPDASFVHVRDYYFDWQATEPATFVIERLDTQGAAARPLDPARVARMLETAAHEVEHSIVFWQQYQARMRDQRGDVNVFNDPRPEGRGVQDIMYGHAFVRLATDEAMVLTIEAADAPMWDVGVYNRAWYEPLDYANGVTSLNHRQVHTAGDGRVRIVVAGRDPGVANWLSTEDRDEVLCTIRWIRAPGQPALQYERVALADLARHLPPDTPTVGPAARRAEVAARAAHVAWRFRT